MNARKYTPSWSCRPVNDPTVIGRPTLFQQWVVDVGPLACSVFFLWGKLVYLTLSLDVLETVTIRPYLLSTTLAGILLPVAPLALLSRNRRFFSLLALNFAITSLALFDVLHVRFYSDVWSVSNLTRVFMLKGFIPSIITSLVLTDALYYVDVLIGFAAVPLYMQIARPIPYLPSTYKQA